jgi:hypothetical protein
LPTPIVNSVDFDQVHSLLAPEVNFQMHRGKSFLVAVGVLSMDTAHGTRRRAAARRSWLRFKEVYSASRRPNAPVLVKFVVARHADHGYRVDDALQQEVQRHDGDVVVVEMKERRSRLKNDSTTYALWGLEADIKGMSLKSMLWRKVALAVYATDFIAKLDDDVFLVVPPYVATLATLPKQQMYWGFVAMCRWNSFDLDKMTEFPYVFGVSETTSSDLARAVAYSPHILPLYRNFTGRPSDYLYDRLDREDYMVGATIFNHATPESKVSVYHDCRIIEPHVVDFEHFKSRSQNFTRFRTPSAIAIHKLPLNQFESAFFQYFRQRASWRPPLFVETPFHLHRYRMHRLRGNYCTNSFGKACRNQYTLWPELGPLVTQRRLANPLVRNAFQNLTHERSVVLAMGVVSSVSATSRVRRKVLRDLMWSDSGMWFAQPPDSRVRRMQPETTAVRFLMYIGDGDHLSAAMKAESYIEGDIVAMRLQPHAPMARKFLMWLRVAVKLYRAPWIGFCTQEVAALPKMQVPGNRTTPQRIPDVAVAKNTELLLKRTVLVVRGALLVDGENTSLVGLALYTLTYNT